MMRYDSYRTRRLTLNISSYVYNVSVSTSPSAPHPSWYSLSRSAGSPTPTDMARARVNAIRDLMRMEMPDRWSDIATGSTSNPVITTPLLLDPNGGAAPALTQRYFNAYYVATRANPTDTALYSSAKLLYMIVMSDSEAAHEFAADEVGTVDGSGLPVFLDAWGNPIFYLRWPVGFLPSVYVPSLGRNVACDTDLQTNATYKDPQTGRTRFVAPDPFDPHGAFTDDYAVFPLIYSAGPDGYTDINVGTDGAGNSLPYPWGPSGKPAGQLDQSGNFDPFNTDRGNLLAGQPNPSPGLHGAPPLGTVSHYDNIHNQHVEAK
jgi:hypothetical protein